MTTHSIRGLLFDKDGTLFDFGLTWSAVIELTLERLARSPAEHRDLAASVGYLIEDRSFVPGAPIVAGSVSEIAEIWGRIRADLMPEDIERLANDTAEEAVMNGALSPAVPDLPGFLDDLRGAGYVLGVATHDSEAAAHQQLHKVGVRDRFAFVAGYDSGHGLKPGPGMLLAFAAETGLQPREIAMIGDSPGDLMVAVNAKAAMAIGVLTGPAGAEELAPHADHVLASIGDMPALLAALA